MNQNSDNGNLPQQLSLHNVMQDDFSHVNYLDLDEISLPPVLSKNDPIEVLGMPLKLENSLKFAGGILTIGQLCDIPNTKLLKMRNVGPKAVSYLNQIRKKIEITFGTLPEQVIDKVSGKIITERAVIPPKDELVNILLERCGNERTKDIIVKRYGLMSGERQTLEEIGEFYGVTRERVRQIVDKALNRMKQPTSSAVKPLAGIAEETLFKNGGILSADEADKEIPEALGGIKDDGSSVLDLLSDLSLVQRAMIGDIQIYSPKFNGISLQKLSDKIIALVKSDDLGVDTSSIVKKIWLFNQIKDERFIPKEFILRYCQIDPRIDAVSLISSHPEVIFRHYTRGHIPRKRWVILMQKVLEEEQIPLHYSEIANRVNDLIGNSEKQLDVRKAHSILVEDKVFAHSGANGTYGLTSWGLRKESTPQLIAECMKKAGFPLHWKQIYNYVSKYKNTKPNNIHACLETNRLFKKVDSGIYWFREEQ